MAKKFEPMKGKVPPTATMKRKAKEAASAKKSDAKDAKKLQTAIDSATRSEDGDRALMRYKKGGKVCGPKKKK